MVLSYVNSFHHESVLLASTFTFSFVEIMLVLFGNRIKL